MSSIFKKLLKKSTKAKQGRDRPNDRDVTNKGGDSDGESNKSNKTVGEFGTSLQESKNMQEKSSQGTLSERMAQRLGLRQRGGADGATEKSDCSDGAAAAAACGPDGYSLVEIALMEDDDLKCSCCYELLVDPTTLNCGHSFCRHCLALWLTQRKQRICPQCRSVWMGFPQINYSLRNIMKHTLPHEYQRRETQVLNDRNFQAALKVFNKERSRPSYELSGQAQGHNMQRPRGVMLIERAVGMNWQNVIAFKNGVILTAGVICAFYLLSFMFHWLFDHEEELVSRWSVDRVQIWLKEQGEWAEKDVAPKFMENQISGNLLLALNEEDFQNLVTLDDLHFRALVMSVNALKDQGRDIPSTLFQYKARFLGRFVFLLFGLRNYPRLTIFWMWIFEHNDLFLPFAHVTSPVLENMSDLNLFSFPFPALTLGQWIDFGINWIVFPYWLIAKFSWRCSGITWIQMLLTIICCLVKTGMEGAGVRLIYKNPRKLTTAVTNHLKQISTYPLVAFVWNFIPTFLINICVYFAIYLMPFVDIYNLYNLIRLTIAR